VCSVARNSFIATSRRRASLYIPNEEVIAVTKSAPSNRVVLRLRRKAGFPEPPRNGYSFNFFNFDNFTYTAEAVGQTSGPQNPSETPVTVPFPS